MNCGYPDTRCSVRVPELYQGAEASLSSRPGLGARHPGGIGRLRTSIHPGHRRQSRRRVAGDAPPRLLLRDSPWDACGGRGQPPLPVRLLLAGRLLRRWTPLGDRRRRGLGCCTRPGHRTNGHPGRTLTGGASHEPWAILCRHPPVPEVPEHSVNPCLVIGARNAALGGEPAAQGSEQPILLRIAEADIVKGPKTRSGTLSVDVCSRDGGSRVKGMACPARAVEPACCPRAEFLVSEAPWRF